METQEYKNIFEQEESHFFYKANHAIILSLVEKYLPSKKIRILDAGSGTGLLASKLQKFGRVSGIDIHPEAIRYSKKRKVRVLMGSLSSLPFKKDSFDLVTCIDVLYHRKVSDQNALIEILRVLKPGGFLILRVPAIAWLRLAHDRFVHTRERYTKEKLEKRLKKAGFLIQKVSYINLLLIPFAVYEHIIQRISKPKKSSAIRAHHKITNSVLTKLLSVESYLTQFIDLPFGIGLIAVCSKPSGSSRNS